MKKVLIPALAAAALAAAVSPALAQPYGDRGNGDRAYTDPANAVATGANYDEREARISERIDEGVRGGGITRQEAWRLRSELRSIQDLEHRYRHNGYGYQNGRGGLSHSERLDLERRLDALSRQVFAQRHDEDRRYR